MCVCKCVCVYIHIYSVCHTYTYICASTYIHACMHTYIHISSGILVHKSRCCKRGTDLPWNAHRSWASRPEAKLRALRSPTQCTLVFFVFLLNPLFSPPRPKVRLVECHRWLRGVLGDSQPTQPNVNQSQVYTRLGFRVQGTKKRPSVRRYRSQPRCQCCDAEDGAHQQFNADFAVEAFSSNRDEHLGKAASARNTHIELHSGES